jgi:hypothetical protein
MAGSRPASEERRRVSRGTTEEPEGRGAPAIERDAQGWPLAFWELAGSAPHFDLDRAAAHERGDMLGADGVTAVRRGRGGSCR